MLNIIVAVLCGSVITIALFLKHLLKNDILNDDIFKTLEAIVKLQDKQIEHLKQQIDEINKYIHEVL